MVETCRESEGPHQVVKTNSEDEDQVSTSEVCFEEEDEEEEEEGNDDDDDLKTDGAGGAVALAHKPGDLRPNFGSVVVNNSSDVHFGTKAFYNGPVTIKQYVYNSKNGNVDVRHGDSEDTVNSNTPPAVNGSLAPIWQPSPNEEEQKPEETQRPFVKKWRFLLIIVCTSVLLIVITLVAVFLAPSSAAPEQPSSSSRSVENPGVNFVFNGTDNTPSGKLRIINRREWLAQPPIRPATPLKHPVPYVVILHTATENCSTQAQCVFFVRHTQTFHIESNGWWDIGYSFLVGGDGNVYEGRGWDGVGAFAYGYNNVSIGISFIGTFIYELPPPKQIAAGKALIAEGVRLGKISKDYKLLAHRQLSPTESPGLAFFENIKTWDHWAEKP